MWKGKNKAAKTAKVEAPVEIPEAPAPENTEVDTLIPELSTNKEFPISDINGTEIGRKVLTAEGEFVTEYFFSTVRRIDGSEYIPTEETEISANLYIEFEDTDGALRFSPEPDSTPATEEVIETTEETVELPSETPNEEEPRVPTASELITFVRDEKVSAENPFSHKIKKLLSEVLELM